MKVRKRDLRILFGVLLFYLSSKFPEGLIRHRRKDDSMYNLDFMSDFEYCAKYGVDYAALTFGLIRERAMVYDQVERKICIVNLLGKSESQIYWGLCHELLHAILHRVMGEKVCIALDNITEFNERTPDGKNAFIWIGDEPEKAHI